MTEHPIETGIWADRHAEWSTFLGDVVAAARASFETLHAIRYDAPWRRSPDRAIVGPRQRLPECPATIRPAR